MKKPLLIGLSLLSAGLITGIYAQTTTAGTSIMDKMKAVAHSFTLSSVLNPTDTGLTSDPVKGKKTGDILTAGEWNRMLELVSEGGSGGGGSGWVDVPLTDTADFDSSCLYRYKTGNTGHAPYLGTSPYYFPNAVDSKQLIWWFDQVNQVHHISSTSKTVYRIDGVSYPASGGITKIEKLCGGGGATTTASGGGATILEGGIIKTSPKTISNWDLITLEGSWNSGGGDAAPTGGYIYKLGGQAKLAYVEASGISKDITLTTTAQNVHNLTVKLSGDSVIIDPSSSNTLAYIVWKLGGSSSGTQSGPVYINPDNTDFAPLDCTPGTTYMINPIVYGAASASTYTDKKLANLKPGNWKLTGSGFLRIRNHDSGSSQTLRVSTVMDGVATHLLNNTVDIGFYANQVSSSFSVPASKTVDLQVSIRNNALQGGNIVLWCVN